MEQDETASVTRGKSRFLAALPAVLHCDGQDFPCSAHDLSRAGLLLEGSFPSPAEMDVRITLSSAARDLTVVVSGRVMHIHEHEDGKTLRLGVQFEPTSNETTEALERLVSRVVEGMAPAALDGIDETASLTEIRAALALISPAHRVALASRCGPRERTILRHDADPHVLEALARNPTTNLPEVRLLLRRGDLLPSTLEVIASDLRFNHNEEIRIMVATHPRVTFPTAEKIVGRMNEITQGKVILRPGLQPGVKQKLMAKLSRKHRGG